MQQDLRDLFKKDREQQKYQPKQGHEARFLELLEEKLPKAKKRPFYLLKIAAAILILATLGYLGFKQLNTKAISETKIVEKADQIENSKGISLGDLSPDLKKVENYYVANINLELSKLKVSDENRGLVDSYMQQLADLNIEYKKLNTELNEMGPNDQTISALIQNLQLRLQLLQKLKKKLNELNTSKNEQVETTIM